MTDGHKSLKVTGSLTVTWLNPIAEIQSWIDEVNSSPAFSPDRLVFSQHHFRWFEEALERGSLSKRAFRRWRGKRRAYWKAALSAPPELPNGVFERSGQLFYTCLSCGETVPVECDLDEFDPAVAYCGGSPRCLP
jgi:hypothetical protein